MTIERMYPEQFTYDLWAGGSLATFGVATRYLSIVQHRLLIRQHAIGYCPGQLLHVRPKTDCVAVMFWTPEETTFWTHLTANEFTICFPEITP